jgi:hypothetical protein
MLYVSTVYVLLCLMQGLIKQDNLIYTYVKLSSYNQKHIPFRMRFLCFMRFKCTVTLVNKHKTSQLKNQLHIQSTTNTR